jgi:hypothetical protein
MSCQSAAILHRHLNPQHARLEEAHDVHSREGEKHGSKVQIPKLNIVIMVIGSRGDIQKILKEKYGHRVRIATHPAFQTFVEEDIGLEFFLVGGDPFRAYGVHGQESRTHSVRGDGERLVRSVDEETPCISCSMGELSRLFEIRISVTRR